MRHRIFILFAALIATWGSMLHGQDSGPVNGTLSSPAILSPDSVMTVYGRKGTLTTVTLLTDKPVEGVMRGGTEINVVQEANVIHIQPLIPEGMSSVTFRVAGVTYVIRVRITTEDPSIPNPVFTFAKLGQFDDLDKVLTNAPVMRPSEIDLNGAVRVIQRASSDKQFRATLRNYAVLPVRKIYSWNHNEIHLLEAYQFADLDLIIFKVSWVNRITSMRGSTISSSGSVRFRFRSASNSLLVPSCSLANRKPCGWRRRDTSCALIMIGT